MGPVRGLPAFSEDRRFATAYNAVIPHWLFPQRDVYFQFPCRNVRTKQTKHTKSAPALIPRWLFPQLSIHRVTLRLQLTAGEFDHTTLCVGHSRCGWTGYPVKRFRLHDLPA